jgi:hypothetical protein
MIEVELQANGRYCLFIRGNVLVPNLWLHDLNELHERLDEILKQEWTFAN